MRYWEACEAQVTAAEAIEECRKHYVAAVVRDRDGALIDKESCEEIGLPDDCGEFYGGDVLGFPDIDRRPFAQTASGLVLAGRSSPGWAKTARASFALANRACHRR